MSSRVIIYLHIIIESSVCKGDNTIPPNTIFKKPNLFLAIPGMAELRCAEGDAYEQLSCQYPDAAFAL